LKRKKQRRGREKKVWGTRGVRSRTVASKGKVRRRGWGGKGQGLWAVLGGGDRDLCTASKGREGATFSRQEGGRTVQRGKP